MRIKVHADIDGLLEELDALHEVEAEGWDYTLPEQFQEDVEVADSELLPDAGWDYVLPEQFQF